MTRTPQIPTSHARGRLPQDVGHGEARDLNLSNPWRLPAFIAALTAVAGNLVRWIPRRAADPPGDRAFANDG